jgi:hypothetical protein
MDGHGPFLRRLPQREKQQLNAVSSLGNPPRILMILGSDWFSDSTLLVV